MDKVEIIKLMIEAKKSNMTKEFDFLKKKLNESDEPSYEEEIEDESDDTGLDDADDFAPEELPEASEEEEDEFFKEDLDDAVDLDNFSNDDGADFEDDADHPGEEVEDVEEEEDEVKTAIAGLKAYGLTKDEIKLVLDDALEDSFKTDGEDEVEERRRELDL